MFTPSRSIRLALPLIALASAPLLAQERRSDSLFTVEKFLDFEQVADPQISPDASQIIYTRRHVNKLEDRFDAELWIMNADGSKNRFLSKGGGARWSPDGTRIAYLDSGDPRGTQLFVRWMDAEGATSQITRVDQSLSDIKWSPDGKSIGFSMLVPTERTWHIDMPAPPPGAHWTSGAEVREHAALSTGPCGFHQARLRASLRRLGRRRHAARDHEGRLERRLTLRRTGRRRRLGLVAGWEDDRRRGDRRSESGSRVSRLEHSLDRRRNRRQASAHVADGSWDDPVFSPDGRKIAYSGYPAAKATYQAPELFLMNADGSGAQKITSLDRDPGGILVGARRQRRLLQRRAARHVEPVFRARDRRRCEPRSRPARTCSPRAPISRTGIGAGGAHAASRKRRTSCAIDATKRGSSNDGAAHARQRRSAFADQAGERGANRRQVDEQHRRRRVDREAAELRSVEEVSAHLRDSRRPARDVQRRRSTRSIRTSPRTVSSCSTRIRADRPATARRSATRSITTIRARTTTT